MLANHSERIWKFKGTGNLKHIFEKKLNTVRFVHDAAYSGSKDWDKRIIPDKILKDRGHEIAIDPKYDEYQKRISKYGIFFWQENRIESEYKWRANPRITQTSN